MKTRATIELEFEAAGKTSLNARDGALIRGLKALKASSYEGRRPPFTDEEANNKGSLATGTPCMKLTRPGRQFR
jgi:hypothetical protein